MIAFQITREGTPVRKALDKLRAEIVKTRNAIRDTSAAEVPLDEIRVRLRHAIATELYNRTPQNKFEEFARAVPMDARLSIDLRLVDLAYILGPEELVNLIAARLAERGREPGLPAAQRVAKLDELGKELDRLERAEEIEILQLEAAGHTILRREDARPDLLFQIWAHTT